MKKWLLLLLLLIIIPVMVTAEDYSSFDGIIRNEFVCKYKLSARFKMEEQFLTVGDSLTENDKNDKALINDLTEIQISLLKMGDENKRKLNFSLYDGGSSKNVGDNFFEFSQSDSVFKNMKAISPSPYVVLPTNNIRIYIGNSSGENYFDVYKFFKDFDYTLGSCPPTVYLERRNEKEYWLHGTMGEAKTGINDVIYELSEASFGKPGSETDVIKHDIPGDNASCQFKNPYITSCKAIKYTSANWGHLKLTDTRIEFGTIKNNNKTNKYLYIKDRNFGASYSIVSDDTTKLTAYLHDLSFNISDTDYKNLFTGIDTYAKDDDIKIVATSYTNKIKDDRGSGIYIYITHKDNSDIIGAYDNEDSITTYIQAVREIISYNFDYSKFAPMTGVLTCNGLLGGENSEVRKLLTNILKFIRYGGPILMLLLTIVDLVKTVTSGDEKDFKKVFQNFIKRFIAAALLFFINDIIGLIFLIVGLDYECVIDIK